LRRRTGSGDYAGRGLPPGAIRKDGCACRVKTIGQWAGQTGAAHSGTWSAWLDGYGTSHTDTAAQTVTVPTGCTHATVSFWMHINTTETTTIAKNDVLTVTLGSATLATYSNLNHSSGYVLITLPVAALPHGTTSSTLKFTGIENGSSQTSFVIDDTSLTLS